MRKMVVMFLLATLLTGCAAPVKETGTSAVSDPVLQTASPGGGKMQASMVESAARPLLEAEILAAYERALRVYSWFDLSPLPTSDETVFSDGETCRRVDMEGIEELEDLQTYLRSVFSQELADRLLDGETARIQYRDINGALYVVGERRNRDAGKGAIRIETEQLDEITYFVNVLVDLLDEDGETVVGLESWSFPYVFEDDRWVFTDFRLVY